MIETMTTARLFFLLAAVTACLPLAGQTYKDPNQPLEKRVDDLLSRMTLEEKASQLLSASPAIERLGVPVYDWWNECLHGVARAGRATVFPETMPRAEEISVNGRALVFTTALSLLAAIIFGL